MHAPAGGLTAIEHLVLSPGLKVCAGEQVPASSVGVGVAVVVAPGAQVPSDGVVTNGSSAANEAMITGAPLFHPLRHRNRHQIHHCTPPGQLRRIV